MGVKRTWLVVGWTVVVIAIVTALFELASDIDPISGGDAGPEAFFAVGVAIWLFGLFVYRGAVRPLWVSAVCGLGSWAGLAG
jgi:polyferredoxin